MRVIFVETASEPAVVGYTWDGQPGSVVVSAACVRQFGETFLCWAGLPVSALEGRQPQTERAAPPDCTGG
jgi:hypothetical protein